MSSELFMNRNTAISSESQWTRIAITCAGLSAIFAAIGIVFLVIFFSGVPVFGPMNDVAVILHYLLLLPIMLLIHRILPARGGVDQVIRALGLLGAVLVIVLQSLLVLGVLPFERQIVMVVPAFLVVAVWFITMERGGRDDARLPKGAVKALLAGLVFGYPFWAMDLRRRLIQNRSASDAGEGS